MSYEELAGAFAAVMTILRAVLFLVDVFNLDERVPKIKPVVDRVGAFLGGRKGRLEG